MFPLSVILILLKMKAQMASVIPHKRKNLFRKDFSNGSQDSDVFFLVPTGGSILSTLYPSKGLSWRLRPRADTSVSNIGKIYIFRVDIYHQIVETTLLTMLKPSYQPILGKMRGRREAYLQFKEDGITLGFPVFNKKCFTKPL